ncbi:MAG: TfoX/Sxy family protein [Mariniphaga sp.]|nr:TfoX/Sxy family protein [Mariniphaga sp.]
MAYDEFLADRVKTSLKDNKAAFEEKKMFGGVCFLVDDKMCVGVINNNVMIRIDPENQEDFLKEKGCRIMDFTKRPMKGFLYVSPEGVDMEEDMNKWVTRCLEFNPKTKSSKKKK